MKTYRPKRMTNAERLAESQRTHDVIAEVARQVADDSLERLKSRIDAHNAQAQVRRAILLKAREQWQAWIGSQHATAAERELAAQYINHIDDWVKELGFDHPDQG